LPRGLSHWLTKRVIGIFRRKDTAPAQQHLWLRPDEIVTGPNTAFYKRLAALPEKACFAETVHRILAANYMLDSSERGIASLYADSPAMPRFLG
jgi:hypothetical protein